MWLLIIAIVALAVGNWLRNVGIEEARANTYQSPASLAGQRKSGLGTWINLAGSICLTAAIIWLWP
jgi:hypothetical protein